MNWLPIPQPEVRELGFEEAQAFLRQHYPEAAMTVPQFDLTPLEIERELFRASERSVLRAEATR